MSNSGDPSLNSAPESDSADALTPDASANPDSSSSPPSSRSPSGDNAPPLDYQALARFLLEPLIDLPSDLHISTETTAHNTKVWLRVSLGQADRGRAFGRGGRNIRAIRAVLRAAGKNVGQNVSLEVLGEDGESQGNRSKPKPRKAGDPRPSKPKPKPKQNR